MAKKEEKKSLSRLVYYIIGSPICSKKIFLEEKLKTIVRCSKCSHFLLLSKGESEDEVYNNLTHDEKMFFSMIESIEVDKNFHLLVGDFNFNEENLELLKEKSKKVGKALEMYLNSGTKKNLTSLEKNILYKLKAENIIEIETKIEDHVKYMKAKIECVKLLKILGYGLH